ncbi:MAG: plastocyanin/azurin family copper-binding protein, partial [Rudaea sp.]|nr:plastocyanin/azurin family copper-binding protein [Rudaea sp.]
MQLRDLKVLLVWLVPLIATPAWATNHMVTVGGDTSDGYYGNSPVLSFSPVQMTINAGDTVTFTNAGGMHNVHSDAGAITSFQCSNDCISNNAPSTAGWSATVTFPTAGTIGYHCDEHVSMGMTGSIIVNAVTPPPPTITIGGYMSGNWYNPQQAGQGFQIEAATNNNMVAIW